MSGRALFAALEGLAAVLLLALVAVTGIDVIGRYLMNAPLPGAFELTELMLGALVFAALPLVSREGSHVEVDLIVTALPRRITRPMGLAAAAVSAAVLVYFAWQLGQLALRLFEDGRQSNSLGVPFWPFAALGAAACLTAAGAGVVRALRA